MGSERKGKMISARLPDDLVARLDYVHRNTDNAAVTNRSTALQAAVEGWLPGQEDKLRALGILAKKTHP